MHIRTIFSSIALAVFLLVGGASLVDARLAVRRPSVATPAPPAPTPAPPGPTAVPPDPTPVVPPSDEDPCSSGLRLASARLASFTHQSMGTCLTRGIECLGDLAALDECCADSAARCRRHLANVANARAEFEREVTRRACSDLDLAVLLAPDGLGFESVRSACLRLLPPVDLVEKDDLAECLGRLTVGDVIHRMVSVEHPRALEAVFCMEVEDEVPGVLFDDPATCAGSAVPPAPTPAPTPDPNQTPDPNETPDPNQTPDPNPTPGGPTTCSTVMVVMDANFSEIDFPDVSGITIDVVYPADKVEIPGCCDDPSVSDRVSNLTGVTSGLFNVADQDDPSQGPTSLSAGLVAIPGPIPPGAFAQAEFDCVDGAAAPAASEFTCSIDASTLLGGAVDATCSLSVSLQ